MYTGSCRGDNAAPSTSTSGQSPEYTSLVAELRTVIQRCVISVASSSAA
jgi:hypothetical protein